MFHLWRNQVTNPHQENVCKTPTKDQHFKQRSRTITANDIHHFLKYYYPKGPPNTPRHQKPSPGFSVSETLPANGWKYWYYVHYIRNPDKFFFSLLLLRSLRRDKKHVFLFPHYVHYSFDKKKYILHFRTTFATPRSWLKIHLFLLEQKVHYTISSVFLQGS